MLERSLENPLDCKEIKPVNPKGNQSRIFIGRTDAEAETPILWPPDVKNWLIWKDPDAGKDWRWEEKGTAEDEMVGCRQLLDGHEFEQAPGVGDGQGSLECCSPWGHTESDTTEWLNWTDGALLFIVYYLIKWAPFHAGRIPQHFAKYILVGMILLTEAKHSLFPGKSLPPFIVNSTLSLKFPYCYKPSKHLRHNEK